MISVSQSYMDDSLELYHKAVLAGLEDGAVVDATHLEAAKQLLYYGAKTEKATKSKSQAKGKDAEPSPVAPADDRAFRLGIGAMLDADDVKNIRARDLANAILAKSPGAVTNQRIIGDQLAAMEADGLIVLSRRVSRGVSYYTARWTDGRAPLSAKPPAAPAPAKSEATTDDIVARHRAALTNKEA